MFTKTKNSKKLIGVTGVLVAVCMGFTLIPGRSASALLLDHGGKFYADFQSYDEALEAADDLNTEISGEGDVLLKNDGTLPLSTAEKISVFGGAQDSFVGGSGSATLTEALRTEGFKVNSSLENYYQNSSSSIGTENSDFGKDVEQTFSLYGDAAVIILSRTGGEGNDLDLVTEEKEDNKDGDGNDYGWKHKALYKDEDGNEYKHYLQLTDSEEKLISYVKDHFDKIVVVLNTSNVMEIGNLKDDPAINAMLWIGRPGSTGIAGLAKILSGEINPSGKLVDEWYRDLTEDPTWYNFGTYEQFGGSNTYIYDTETTGAPESKPGGGVAGGSGFFGVDYEEGIYLGYKYVETVYAELQKGSIKYNKTTDSLVAGTETLSQNDSGTADEWWANTVAYPFGYGLSYTDFSYSLGKVYYYNGQGVKTELGEEVSHELFESEAGAHAQVEKLYAPVTVTNEGSVAGKQVVQVYVTMPYFEGEVEKAEVNLVGYAKTDELRPGESQTVNVAFNVQDFASFDYNDANDNGYSGYELDAGDYTIKVMEDSHTVAASQEFTLDEDALLKSDDFSGNEVKTWFSNGDTYDTRRMNHSIGSDDDFLQINEDKDAAMTNLSRSDLVGTFPEPMTEADRTLTDEFVKGVMFWRNFDADLDKYDDSLFEYYKSEYAPDGHYDWWKSDVELKELMAGWTQATEHKEDYSDVTVKLRDMAGIDIEDKAWDEFMNQLTFDELCEIINHGSHTTAAIPSIDKTASSDENGPNSFNGKTWCDESVVASTWNVELAEQYGIINANLAMFNGEQGWYGPGINTHRSPFGGRNNEYYSQDGIQGGYIAAAVVGGAQSRGLNVWVKHIFMNDQETNRNVESLFTWCNEQAIREIYAKQFQMAMQEGGATAAMAAFNRIGGVVAAANYNFINGLLRQEWGWEGEFVTDAYAGLSMKNMDILNRMGCNLPDGTASKDPQIISGVWDPEAVGVGTEENPSGNVVLGTSAAGVAAGSKERESLLQWYIMRTNAEQVLYVAANTLNNQNGVVTSDYADKSVELTQGVAASASVAMAEKDLNGCSATYKVTEGTLPAGVSLNASTGALTGIPTEAGTFKVTVQAAVSGWINASAEITIEVKSAFEAEVVEGGKVGEAFTLIIDSDVVTSEKYTQGITYSIFSGNLPAGLTISDGMISGTPTESGTFNVTVKIEGSYRSGRKNVTDTYYLDLVIDIAGESTQPVVSHGDIVGADINDKGELVLTFEDGFEDNLGVVVGADGTDGVSITKIEKTGTECLVDTYTITLSNGTTQTFTVTNGADGEQGPVGPAGADGADGADGSGCGSAVNGLIGFAIAVPVIAVAAIAMRKKKND